MFETRIGWKSLAQLCRGLATMLHSGVSIQKAIQLTAEKSPDQRTRAVLGEVSRRVGEGEEVSEAMRRQGRAFPTLMIDMLDVAEQTGALPEILHSLAGHYENNLRLRRSFYAAIAWPMFQMLAAIFVIALAIWVIGFFGGNREGSIDIIGLGLRGTEGALIWLFSTLGTLLGVIVAYQIFKRSFAGRKMLDPLLMQIPVVGQALRSFAIARFSWGFALTQQSGMNIEASLKASLRATNNGAFLAAIRPVWESVREGESLNQSLAQTGLFPSDYLHMVEVAEHSGTVPEMLDKLSPQFEDQARRSLATLTAMFGWGIWMVVAAFIIFLVFNIFMQYIGMIQSFTNEAM